MTTSSLPYTQIITMDTEEWENIDTVLLRMNHTLIATAISATRLTFTVDTVTDTQIEGTSFLKYVNAVLLNKSQFGFFYDNLVTQVTRYNIFLGPLLEITPIDGVVPDFMSANCKSITVTILYSKICQKDTIADSYMDAHNLLMMTTNGYDFLQLLHQHTHPLLAVKNIATADIPK